MNFNEHINKFLWIIPAITLFFIVLIPTLKYNWPLSWDIVYHVQYAQVYAQYGFVLKDPLLNAPSGQNIGYPPLFHFLIAGLGTLLKIDFFQVARFLQPVLAMLIVLSVSYVAKEFYGKIAGISAGFIMISSYLITRIVLPIPENFALIFLPLAVYLYYRSIKEGNLKYALTAGVIFLITILIHPLVPLCIFLTVTSFTLLGIVINKNINIFKNYGAFLAVLIILTVGGLITLSLLKPDLFYSLIHQGLAAIGYGAVPKYNQSLSAVSYLGNIGSIVLAFAAIGGIFAIKKMQKRHLFILVWILTMFLLSNAYWFGLNVITYRVLIYLLIPLSILGGFGLSQIYYKFKEYNILSSRSFRSGFLIVIFVLFAFSGVLTVENPKIAKFGTTTELGYLQTAPPSNSEVDLARWFNENGDKNRSVLISNLYSGYFLAAESGMPIHYGFEYFNKSVPLSTFEKQKIGYIVYDKRLTFPSENGTIYLKTVPSQFSPLYYFSGDIHANINEIIPDFVKVVYENKDFIICKVQY
jgi:asparagine N-glycosylation enzyme membrane subunit Stt3